MLGLAKPKLAEGRQHPAFFWDRIGQDHVERADPVGRDKKQGIAEIKDFADLAAANFLEAGNFNIGKGLAHVVSLVVMLDSTNPSTKIQQKLFESNSA